MSAYGLHPSPVPGISACGLHPSPNPGISGISLPSHFPRPLPHPHPLQGLVNVLMVAPAALLGLVNGTLRLDHREALRWG